jgi:hypothetical protein
VAVGYPRSGLMDGGGFMPPGYYDPNADDQAGGYGGGRYGMYDRSAQDGGAQDYLNGRAADMQRRLQEMWSGGSGGAQPGYGYGLGLGNGFGAPTRATDPMSYNRSAATTGYGFGADQGGFGGFDQSAVDAALAGLRGGGGFTAPPPVQPGGGDRGASWDQYQTGEMIPGIGVKGLGGAVGIKQEAIDDGWFHDSAGDHGGNADRSDSANN